MGHSIERRKFRQELTREDYCHHDGTSVVNSASSTKKIDAKTDITSKKQHSYMRGGGHAAPAILWRKRGLKSKPMSFDRRGIEAGVGERGA